MTLLSIAPGEVGTDLDVKRCVVLVHLCLVMRESRTIVAYNSAGGMFLGYSLLVIVSVGLEPKLTRYLPVNIF